MGKERTNSFHGHTERKATRCQDDLTRQLSKQGVQRPQSSLANICPVWLVIQRRTDKAANVTRLDGVEHKRQPEPAALALALWSATPIRETEHGPAELSLDYTAQISGRVCWYLKKLGAIQTTCIVVVPSTKALELENRSLSTIETTQPTWTESALLADAPPQHKGGMLPGIVSGKQPNQQQTTACFRRDCKLNVVSRCVLGGHSIARHSAAQSFVRAGRGLEPSCCVHLPLVATLTAWRLWWSVSLQSHLKATSARVATDGEIGRAPFRSMSVPLGLGRWRHCHDSEAYH